MRVVKGICPICVAAMGTIDYRGMKVCKECYIMRRLDENNFNNKDLEDNTFIFKGNGKEYCGLIMGYQHKIGESQNDKFYLHINVNDEDFHIFYDNWMTEKEIMNSCDRFKINIEKLLKE